MSVEIKLSSYEIVLAAISGVMRQVENIKIGRRPAYGAGDRNDWQLHIEGCLGESALAKYLGIYWGGKGQLRDPDVGDVDVRTSSRDNGALILHDADPDDRVFWLVCGRNGTYVVHGWIKAEDGKKKKWFADKAKNGRPAYFVPQSELNKI